jgi:hypothetical protein
MQNVLDSLKIAYGLQQIPHGLHSLPNSRALLKGGGAEGGRSEKTFS